MPRPKKPGAPEPKRRSRTGCWPCKARKIKCIRLNWEGRVGKRSSVFDHANSPASQLAGHSSVSSTTATPTPMFSTAPYHGLVQFTTPVLSSPGIETSACDTKSQADPAQQCFQSTLRFDGVTHGVSSCNCSTFQATNRLLPFPALPSASPHASPELQLPACNDQSLLYSTASARNQRRTPSRTPPVSNDSCQQSPLASPGSSEGTLYLSTSQSQPAPPCTIQTFWRDQTEGVMMNAAGIKRGSMPSEHSSKRMKLATLVEGE
ncbi:hypothetical protein KEM54_005996 [Ascosphaera aggregata]|nr:hypothetical protein KEM54_005996 [Ascosphaera aggregata]